MCLTNLSKLTTFSARFLHVTMKKPSLCDDCPNSMYSVPSSAVSLHLLCLPCTQKASSAGFSMTLMFDVLQADGLVSIYRPDFRLVFHAVFLCYEWTHCTAVSTLSSIQMPFKSYRQSYKQYKTSYKHTTNIVSTVQNNTKKI